MMNKETEGITETVCYRRAKLWQIILYSLNALIGMSMYSLMGLASYSASIGYGIATVVVGYILTGTRIFDAVTDPMLAFLYDRVNTRHGKIRILMSIGWVIEAAAALFMFDFASSKGHGIVTFVLIYVVYIIGYTICNMTALTIPPLLTNDPKQRPQVGVWQTVFNYLVPVTLTIVLNVVLLPKFGGTYNQQFLSTAAAICVGVSFIGLVAVCLAVGEYDVPGNFKGLEKDDKRLSLRDMADVLTHNHPLQCYIASAASDKIAQQAGSQAIVTTLLYGILIGNMGMATILNMISMLPSILFAALGARYAGKHGNKETIVTWTRICILLSAVLIAFLALINTRDIAKMGPAMILYVVLTFLLNGAKMCVTMGDSAFLSDVVDYEMARSGKFIPAVVTGTYSLIDKLVSSFSAMIATACVALIGYTATMPQPGDELTRPVFWMCIFLSYGLAIIGWIVTLISMRFCHLDKTAMRKVQEDIQERKERNRNDRKTE
jgi:GPH family glycoside/pentoside/hexuronide:cation symporter